MACYASARKVGRLTFRLLNKVLTVSGLCILYTLTEQTHPSLRKMKYRYKSSKPVNKMYLIHLLSCCFLQLHWLGQICKNNFKVTIISDQGRL